MEHIIDTFSNGCKNLFKNPILFAPLLISIVLLLLISSVWVAVVFILAAGTEINWTIFTVSTIVYLLIAVFLSLYVSAGSVGMSKDVISTGKTSFNRLFVYGNKYIVRLFFASIILSILQLVMIIFWLPLIYLCMNSGYTIELFFDLLINNLDALIPFLTSLILPTLLGLMLTLIYLIVISVLFYFVTYAIVVDDLPVFASFKKSYVMLRQNFWKIIIFIVLVYAFTFVITTFISMISSVLQIFLLPFAIMDPMGSIISYVIQIIFQIISTVVSILISVLTIVWTTRFYMSLNDHELYVEEAKENLLETDF